MTKRKRGNRNDANKPNKRECWWEKDSGSEKNTLRQTSTKTSG